MCVTTGMGSGKVTMLWRGRKIGCLPLLGVLAMQISLKQSLQKGKVSSLRG